MHLYVSVPVNQFTQRKATTGGGNLRNVTHPVDSALALCTLCFCHCMRVCVRTHVGLVGLCVTGGELCLLVVCYEVIDMRHCHLFVGLMYICL